jgi:hypothetical protein
MNEGPLSRGPFRCPALLPLLHHDPVVTVSPNPGEVGIFVTEDADGGSEVVGRVLVVADAVEDYDCVHVLISLLNL